MKARVNGNDELGKTDPASAFMFFADLVGLEVHRKHLGDWLFNLYDEDPDARSLNEVRFLDPWPEEYSDALGIYDPPVHNLYINPKMYDLSLNEMIEVEWHEFGHHKDMMFYEAHGFRLSDSAQFQDALDMVDGDFTWARQMMEERFGPDDPDGPAYIEDTAEIFAQAYYMHRSGTGDMSDKASRLYQFLQSL